MNMATFNHRIQIHGIVLQGAENFVIFDSDFEDYMYAADVGDIGDGTRVEPPNDDDHRESYRAWKSDHSKPKTILKRLLSEEVKLAMHGAIPRTSRVHKIVEWLREEYGNEDSSEMQEALEDEINVKFCVLSSKSSWGQCIFPVRCEYRYGSVGIILGWPVLPYFVQPHYLFCIRVEYILNVLFAHVYLWIVFTVYNKSCIEADCV